VTGSLYAVPTRRKLKSRSSDNKTTTQFGVVENARTVRLVRIRPWDSKEWKGD
jgi:hypothetical protein